jgi:protease I
LTVGILLENMFNTQEFLYPYYRLQEAGIAPLVIAPEVGTFTAEHIAYKHAADVAARDVNAADLAGLIIPGGYAPDRLRRHPEILDIVRAVDGAGKPLGVICHASWVIISARIVDGRRLTAVSSTRDDLENAGATYVADERVVVDGNLVTAQSYPDVPAFMKAFLEVLGTTA